MGSKGGVWGYIVGYPRRGICGFYAQALGASGICSGLSSPDQARFELQYLVVSLNKGTAEEPFLSMSRIFSMSPFRPSMLGQEHACIDVPCSTTYHKSCP